MLLSVFGGVTVVAEELSFALPSIYFDIEGFEYGAKSDKIQVSSSNGYFTINELDVFVEDCNGKTIDEIGVGKWFSIVVRFTPKAHYDFSLLSKANVSSNLGNANEFYEEDGSYYAEFKVKGFLPPYEKIEFTVEGYEVGNLPENIVLICGDNGIEVVSVNIYDVTDYFNGIKDSSRLKEVEKIEEGRKYFMGICFRLPEGYIARNMPYEAKILRVNSEEVLPYNQEVSDYTDLDGSCVFMIAYILPEISEEEIVKTVEGDVDGDGTVTVADALSALRTAAGIGDEVSDIVLKKAVVKAVKGDLDGDGKVTVADALAILRIAAGLK